MTHKEATTPPSLLQMFEEILCGTGLFCDSADWHDLKFACHVKWLDPLVKLGAIKKTRKSLAWPDGPPEGQGQFNYYDFKVTPAGLAWWAKERSRYQEFHSGPIDIDRFARPRGDREPIASGRGIGSPFVVYGDEVGIAARCIEKGYLKFEEYYRGSPLCWHLGDRLTVSLTRQGMEYFDSVPVLQLECA